MAPASLGTQTAGSVSRPAAYCGIGAFKPSTGSLSTFGVVPLAARFDTVGFFGYRIEDAAFVFRALAPEFLGPSQALHQVVRLEDPSLAAAESAVAASMDQTAAKLTDAGIAVQSLATPVPFAEVTAAHATIWQFEMSRFYASALAPVIDLVSDQFREAVQEGSAVDENAYLRARRWLEAAIPRFWERIPKGAAILFPAAPGPAPSGMATGDPLFVIPFTALGGPMASLPVGFAPNGLPLGVMLCGAPGSDHPLADFVVQAAGAVELAR